MTEDRDAIRISAKCGDVALHPAQRLDLVEQAVIARGSLRRFPGERGMSEKAERAEAVVDRHHDDTKRCENSRVVATATVRERSAVQPHHHRALSTELGCENVERQAILVGGSEARRTLWWQRRQIAA